MSGPYTTRQAVDRLLAGNPTPRARAYRASVLQRLADDCVDLVPWPALRESLLVDVKRLREYVKTY